MTTDPRLTDLGDTPGSDVCGCTRVMLKEEAMKKKRPTKAELREALDEACDVAIWMSGSADFSPEGKAYEGWLKARERLFHALDVLSREPKSA